MVYDVENKKFLLTLDKSKLESEVSTIEDIVEPYLLQLGFVVRTNRGRCVTRLAYEHFGLPVPRNLREDVEENEEN